MAVCSRGSGVERVGTAWLLRAVPASPGAYAPVVVPLADVGGLLGAPLAWSVFSFGGAAAPRASKRDASRRAATLSAGPLKRLLRDAARATAWLAMSAAAPSSTINRAQAVSHGNAPRASSTLVGPDAKPRVVVSLRSAP